jgi:hypothetical protein
MRSVAVAKWIIHMSIASVVVYCCCVPYRQASSFDMSGIIFLAMLKSTKPLVPLSSVTVKLSSFVA